MQVNISKNTIPTNLCYKYIDLDNLDLISSQALEIIKEAKMPKSSLLYYLDGVVAKEMDRFKLIPELSDSLKKINLYKYWRSTSVVVLYDDRMPIHRDLATETAINIPVANCEGSSTIFYNCEGEAEVMNLGDFTNLEDGKGHDVVYRGFKESVCKEIDRVELIRPAFFNVSIPHTVKVGKKVPRVVISVRIEISPEEFLNG